MSFATSGGLEQTHQKTKRSAGDLSFGSDEHGASSFLLLRPRNQTAGDQSLSIVLGQTGN